MTVKFRMSTLRRRSERDNQSLKQYLTVTRIESRPSCRKAHPNIMRI